MNKNVSEVVIEIGGKEYTLFLNRAGVVAWEKATNLKEKTKEYEKYRDLQKEVELTDDSNPFEIYGDLESMDEDIEEMTDVYAKFYWIVLYTHHKLSVSEAKTVFDTAVEEYGIGQLGELAQQMVEDTNTDKMTKNLKNLKALRPTK